MALVINDRVKETSVTTGTGNFTLAGASQGFESFASGVGDGKTTYYGKGANKDGSWDGQQFQPTKETKLYFDIMKEMLK